VVDEIVRLSTSDRADDLVAEQLRYYRARAAEYDATSYGAVSGRSWVERGGMNSVVLRHCPELAALLPRGASAFAPWRTVRPTSDGDMHGGRE